MSRILEEVSAMTEPDLLPKESIVSEIELNLWETWSNYGRAPDCALHEEKDATWFETPLPIIPYNGVLRFQVTDDPRNRIGSIANHFSDRRVAFMWIVHPSPGPPTFPIICGNSA